MCGVEETTHHGRCTKCHATASRIRCLLKGDNANLAQQWKSFSKDVNIEKASLYARAKTRFGEDLNKLMLETLEESVSHSTRVPPRGTGTSMDEEDMTNKYNEIEFIDGEEVTFVYKREFGFTTAHHSSNKAGTEMVIRNNKMKVKVVRPDPQHCISNALTDGQKKTLTKYIEAAPFQVALLQSMLDDPRIWFPRIKALSERIEHQVAIWGRNIQDGECNMKAAKALWRLIFNDVKTCLRSAEQERNLARAIGPQA